ncbi:MAG: biotin/lipoyl-containing protein, partial [Actinomycetota bacterium]
MADITMPQLGETVTEGTITKWFKKVGDQVAEDEPLFEVSTDKVDSEVPSSAAGYLTEIRVQEGETVDVGVTLAVITADQSAAGAGAGDRDRDGAPSAEAEAPADGGAGTEAASRPEAPG